MSTECLATFDTATEALRFERACREERIPGRIVPVPRTLSESCGFACRFPCDDQERVRALIGERDLDVTGFHQVAAASGRPVG
jgi:hypothetical protein